MAADVEIYRLIFDADPRPMWLFDRETRRFLEVNAAAVRDYGWTREEFLAMTLLDLRPPSERDAFEAGWARKEGATYGRIGRHRKKDGEVIEVDLALSTFMHDGRELTLAIATNVTGIADAERRFRLLVENSAEGISLIREDLTTQYTSPAIERILGWTASEVLNRRPTSLHPDEVGVWQPPKPFESSTSVSRVRHRDGTWRWIEATTTNLLRDPAVRGYVTNYRDITARREAETKTLETWRRLEYLLSATSAVTYTARVTGDFGATFVSANIEKVLGYDREQFVADSGFWLRNIHPGDRAHVDECLRELFATDEHTFDYRFLHADGSWRCMRDAARIVRDDAGVPIEVVGYMIDITEQFQVQLSLQRSEANFRMLIERSPTATYVQRDGEIVYGNPAAAALFACSAPDELVGVKVLDLIHADDRDYVRSRMDNTVAAGTTPPGEARMIRRNGSMFVAEAEALRLTFDGKLASVVFARDVTERAEMFTRMALADRMLTVGTLAAGVAHEINNPLAYVATNLEILAADLPRLLANVPTRVPRDELPPLIADAREGVARVSAIVRDLRTLSKPEDEQRGPVDLATVLASSIKMAHNEIRHRATVVESYAADVPPVSANASRLCQVFLNLLLNAAQAIPEGHADKNEIRVRAKRDGERVVVEVEDTGAGIAPAIIRRIFDPFFTTKAPGAGMGLGLAISHQIVRALGGQISVASSVGAGTTFRVILPPDVARREPAVVVPAVAPAGCARILLVDDEVAVGRSLCALLAGEHEVVAVACARDALDRIRAGETFDVILCDLMMPEVSGIDLYAQFTPEQRARMVFMTGGAFTPQAREFLAGVDRPRLEKPFSERELREVIEQVRAG